MIGINSISEQLELKLLRTFIIMAVALTIAGSDCSGGAGIQVRVILDFNCNYIEQFRQI